MEPKSYIIDIYSEMDDTDIGEELVTSAGDIRCPETGEEFTATFIITNLKKVDNNGRNEGLLNNL